MEKKKYPWTRQRLISAVILFTFLLFPVVINFLSPYIIIDGAFQGIITGSFILFVLLFISSLFLGRLWYSWVCPAAELQEAFFAANNKPVKGKRIDWIKWVIWVLWIEVIVLGVITAGGLTKIAPLHLTESGISVDEPGKYMIFYIVIGSVFCLAVFFGRRTFFHTMWWMSPFMIIGRKISNLFNLPRLRLIADQEKCINCKKCTQVCTMSLDVNGMVQSGNMENTEYILCGNGIDACPEEVIHYTFKPKLN
ncbi:MAG: 4Fe-4S binding protein [Chloroflexota bacterium]|jgi:polyferredoxin|nr:4Fe-4S binding protein [Chloroflexota bacterium]